MGAIRRTELGISISQRDVDGERLLLKAANAFNQGKWWWNRMASRSRFRTEFNAACRIAGENSANIRLTRLLQAASINYKQFGWTTCDDGATYAANIKRAGQYRESAYSPLRRRF